MASKQRAAEWNAKWPSAHLFIKQQSRKGFYSLTGIENLNQLYLLVRQMTYKLLGI